MRRLLRFLKHLLTPTCVDCAGRGSKMLFKYHYVQCTLCRGTGKITDE
jgi:DnaJ-class molecular chaperone